MRTILGGVCLLKFTVWIEIAALGRSSRLFEMRSIAKGPHKVHFFSRGTQAGSGKKAIDGKKRKLKARLAVDRFLSASLLHEGQSRLNGTCDQ